MTSMNDVPVLPAWFELRPPRPVLRQGAWVCVGCAGQGAVPSGTGWAWCTSCAGAGERPAPHPTTHGEAAAWLDRLHAENNTAITNLLGMAERAVERGDVKGARIMLTEAEPYQADNAYIEACWIPKGQVH